MYLKELFSLEGDEIIFDKPKDVAFFNNSGKTPLPVSVKEAGRLAIEREANPWSEQKSFTEQIRKYFGEIVNASSLDDIAIVPSTGFAMTMIAHNLIAGICKKGSTKSKIQVLILQDEMSSEVYAWQEPRQDGIQVEFVIVPHPTSDSGWTASILDYLKNYKIDVCCVPQCHWSDGSYVDTAAVGHYCKENGIKFVIDGTQSVGIMHMDVQKIHCDALACSVHKWLLSPHGMSLLYVHPKYHNEWKPLDQHERSRVAFQNIEYDAKENNIDKHGYPSQFLPGARRLDSGGKKNPILEPMICEALKIVNSLDLVEANDFLKNITDYILNRAQLFGLDCQPGPRCNHIIGLRPRTDTMKKFLTPHNMVEIATKLATKNIFIAVRNNAFRISIYLFTTMDEVDLLLNELEKACSCE